MSEVDLDAVKQRRDWRQTMGGRAPGTHPTLAAMEQDIDDLVAEVERLRAAATESKP